MSRSVFINADGELRSGWKFGVYVLIFLLLWLISGIILGELFAYSPLPLTFLVELGLNAIALFIPAVGATIFMARYVDHRPCSTFVGFQNWPRSLGAGILIGFALLSLLALGFAITGTLRLDQVMRNLPLIGITTAILAVSAANEEIVFRGYPMQSLARGIGQWPAAAVMSGLFGLLHLRNPNASWIGIINTVIAGLMLSAAYYKARSLWLPYGIHAAWNIGLGVVLGFFLSGIDLDSIWETSADGSATLTGGLYGPEGGLVCTFVFLAGFGLIRLISFRSAETKQ